jgi:hypothetical protein
MTTRLLPSTTFAISLLLPTLASAAEPSGGLGRAGQVVVGADLAGALVYTDVTTKQTVGPMTLEVDGEAWEIELQPTLDYFVTDNVTLGFTATLAYFDLDYPGELSDSETNTLGAGVRAGFFLPLADKLSLWTRAGVEYRTEEISQGGSSLPDVDNFLFGLDASFTYDLAPHFFIGAGPAFVYSSADVGDSIEITSANFGLGFGIGGWLD